MENKYKICFVTSCMCDTENNNNNNGIGNLNGRKPVLPSKFGNYDFYLFTNMNNFQKTAWDIIYLSNEFLDKEIKNNNDKNIRANVFRSRYPKWMGWKYIKEHLNKEYDIIFYCDLNIDLNINFDWQEFSKQIIESKSGIMQNIHPGFHNCYQECNAIERFKIDNMNKTREFLKKNNMDEKFVIMQNNIFGYNPKNNKILDAFIDFWKNYTEDKLSFRDQPLWGYISFKHNIKAIVNNKLFSRWDFEHLNELRRQQLYKK